MNFEFQLRDEFKRQPVAEKIIKLLASEIDVSPMVIDGVWGSGKTEFTLKLIQLLKTDDSGSRAIYLDAFQAEHANNPILSLLAEVIKSLPESARDEKIRTLAPTLKIVGKTLGKAAVSWLLKQDTAEIADDYDDEIKAVSNSVIDYSTEKLLESFVKEEEDLKALQSVLEDMVSKKPMVIFIDELDRCRPDYAVSMLESIKHIFDIDGLQFVLVTNAEQLKATINHTYGIGVDAQRYLNKFIAFKVTLSTQVKEGTDIEENSVKHFKRLILNSPVLKDTSLKNISRNDVWTLCYLIQIHKRSLREVETLIRYLEIYHTLCEDLKEDTIFGYSLLSAFGVYLYTFEPKIAEKVLSKTLDGDELLSVFNISKIDELDTEQDDDLHLIKDILSMLGRECAVNFKQFIIENEQDSIEFSQMKRHFFSDALGPPHRVSSIVEKAISELRMTEI